MESSLALKKSDYEVEVADFRGFGRVAADWTEEMVSHIASDVKSGVANFYFPDLGGQVYEWSFLTPDASLTLESGASDLDLPDDFNGFSDRFLFVSTADEYGRKVPLAWGVRRKLAAAPERTGHPECAEVEVVRGTTPTEGTRYRLLVYPQADQAYTLRGRYSLSPHALSGARPHVYGGVAHHQTVLESCLAVAEQRRDDVIGIHTALFKDRLRASIAQDRRMKPKDLGYNADRSDGASPYYSRRGRPGRWWDDVTIDGQAPS